MKKRLRVFFNASVILAGIKSPHGGSAKLLRLSGQGKLEGFISEIVLDEIKRHAGKINLTSKNLEMKVIKFVKIVPSPEKLIGKYKKIVIDPNDLHLFTSGELLKVDFLVSLDKKHVLSLSGKIKSFRIVSPKELIEEIARK